MKTFTDSHGKEWTEEELTTVDAMPPDSFFWDFDIENTTIKRLPKNLYIDNSLDLGYSSIEELQSGLRIEGELSLTNSAVTVLPSNLYALRLTLAKSKLHSIGTSIKVYRLNIDSTTALTSSIECESVYCYHNSNQDTTVLDFSNIKTKNLVLDTPGSYSIRHVKAATIHVGSESSIGDLSLDLHDSEFVYMHIGKTTGKQVNPNICTISLTSVVGQKLYILNNKNVGLKLSISASIDDVIVYDRSRGYGASDIKILSLYLNGSLRITDGPLKNAPFLLPETGIVYGDLTVPNGLNIPETLSCLGTIYYS